jgi:hypothetical protein
MGKRPKKMKEDMLIGYYPDESLSTACQEKFSPAAPTVRDQFRSTVKPLCVIRSHHGGKDMNSGSVPPSQNISDQRCEYRYCDAKQSDQSQPEKIEITHRSHSRPPQAGLYRQDHRNWLRILLEGVAGCHNGLLA